MRLIDADALIDKFTKEAQRTSDKSFAQALMYVVTCLDCATIQQPAWISCAERLPNKEGEYIVMTNAMGRTNGVLTMNYRFTTVRGKSVKRWEWHDRISPWIVTHWMPLPEPPKGDE